MKHPGDGERRNLDAVNPRLLIKRGQSSKHTLAFEMEIRLRTKRHPRRFRVGAGRAVLAGQPATGERAERSEPDALIRAERKHLALRAAVEQAERILHPVEAAQAG